MEIKSTIVKTLKKHKFLIVLGTLLVGITIAASLSIPFITQYVIDEGITNKNVKLLGILTVVLFLLAIVGYISEISNIYIFTKISKEFINTIFNVSSITAFRRLLPRTSFGERKFPLL